VVSLVWQPAGLAGVDLRSIVIAPTDLRRLYAGGKGFYRSTDDGATWSLLKGDLLAYHLAVSPADHRLIIASSSLACLKGEDSPAYRSTDGGATWQKIADDLARPVFHVLNAQRVYAISCQGVLISDNAGATWRLLANSRSNLGDAVALGLGGGAATTLYRLEATEGGSGLIFKSTNGGLAWQELKPPADFWGPVQVLVEAATPANLFILSNKGVYRSTDGGTTWAGPFTQGLDTARQGNANFYWWQLSALARHPNQPNTLYLGTGGLASAGAGVFVSHDNGNTWQPLGSGLGNRAVRALASSGKTLWAATNQGLYQLTLP